MTRDDVERHLDQLRLGLETELALLRQLQAVAAQQRTVSAARDFEQLKLVSDDRDRLTRSLLAIEEGLSEHRSVLAQVRDQASTLPVYGTVLALWQASSDLVAEILASDRDAMKVLADAEMARRAAMASLERGGTTLAAYRKILAPPVSNAGLLDRRG